MLKGKCGLAHLGQAETRRDYLIVNLDEPVGPGETALVVLVGNEAHDHAIARLSSDLAAANETLVHADEERKRYIAEVERLTRERDETRDALHDAANRLERVQTSIRPWVTRTEREGVAVTEYAASASAIADVFDAVDGWIPPKERLTQPQPIDPTSEASDGDL